MKKKILSLLLILCMCVSVFAGCSLVELDQKSYQEATVATIRYVDGEVDNINKRELLLAYSSYGYNYNSGDYKSAIDQTLQSVIDQHLTIKAVKNYYKDLDVNNDDDPNNDEPLLNDNETSYLWTQTKDSLVANIEEYYFEIIDYKETSTDSDSSEDSNGVKYNPYQSTVHMNDGETVIRFNTKEMNIRDDKSNLIDGEVYDYEQYDEESKTYPFKDKMYQEIYDIMGTDTSKKSVRNWHSAVGEYADIVKENYEYLKYNTDEEWMRFECDRVYEILKNNYIVQKYTLIYNKAQNRDDDLANITVDDILKEYSSRIASDYEKYTADSSSYSTDVLDNISDVDYFLNNGQKYFNVGYIKVNITFEQKNLIDKANGSGNITEKTNAHDNVFGNEEKQTNVVATRKIETNNENLYNLVNIALKDKVVNVVDLYNALNAQIQTYKFKTAEDIERNTALVEGKVNSLTELEIKEALSGLSESEKLVEDKVKEAKKQYAIKSLLDEDMQITEQSRANVFNQYMFYYSDDDNTKNADYATVFGYDMNTQSLLSNSTFSGNENVEKAVLELYRSKTVGDTKLVEVDDGYYIFFYAGEVGNLFENVNENFSLTRKDTIYTLRKTKLSLFTNKTLFDKLYEELLSSYSDSFSVFQNLDIAALYSSDKDNPRRIVEGFESFKDELYN